VRFPVFCCVLAWQFASLTTGRCVSVPRTAFVNPAALFLFSSDATGLLIGYALGFCAGIALFVYGFRLLQRRRLILDTPFSKIRSASMGLVEVSGQAVGPYNLIAPISTRRCYYYRTLVWEYKQQGKNKKWVQIACECVHVPFFVDDNTGRVLVDPRGADLDLHRDFEDEFCNSFFTLKEHVPPNVSSFLGRHGVSTDNKIKVEEYCIKPKTSLFILGTLAENPGLEVGPQPVQDPNPPGSFVSGRLSLGSLAGSIGSLVLERFGGSSSGTLEQDFDEGAVSQQLAAVAAPRPQVVRLAGGASPTKSADMTQQQKVTAALLRAGISNPAAWAAAGITSPGSPAAVIPDSFAFAASENSNGANSAPANGQSASAAAASAYDRHPPTAICKGENDKTFLISWRGQREIARSLGWKCALMIWGGPVLALASLYFFLGFEHLL